ncbi:GPI-anchored surface protein, putative, partial [Bodo saltans]
MMKWTALVAVVLAALCFSGCSASIATQSWIRTQTLRRENGQPSYNYSDAISSLGPLLAIGTTSANRGRGEVNILKDDGGGLRRIATIANPLTADIGDGFGESILLFNYNGFKQVAIAALSAYSGVGCVYIYQQEVNNETLWDYIQVLQPPTGTYVNNFGRTMAYDGSQLLISAERVYASGRRFVVTSINVIGTAQYIQSDGVEDTIGGDPLLVYRSVPDRKNKTYLEFYTSISDADYSLNTGASMAISGDTMVVGASYREQLKYGSGTDGDLDISDVKYLDGTASYNFNTIIIRSGGVLLVDSYDDVRNLGGVMTVKIQTLLYIEKGGLINLTAAGYKGGQTSFTATPPEDGAFLGGGKKATSQNIGLYACEYSTTVSVGTNLGASSVNSLSINQSLPFAEACGGGGGYGTRGTAGTKVGCGTSGAGGGEYGDPALTVLYRGSGGGSGFPWKVGAGGAGGNGGGIVQISAKQIINYGNIDANGGPGLDGGFFSGAGGGGSGGSIMLVGDNLANYGVIRAQGGKGGTRASGSGSGGDFGVRGGDGGVGRIKFDFLQTQAHGIVLPRPVNVTTYLGDVLIYKRNASTQAWGLKTFLPRLPAFQFIGHSVALSGKMLAVASTQGTPVTPLEQVFMIDITHIQNDSSPITTYSVINSPNPKLDRLFGYRMDIENNTLVVSAEGTYETRGVVYIFESRNFVKDHKSHIAIYSRHPVTGDAFGNLFVMDYPKLYIQLPLSQDETLPANTQRSIGCVVVYKHMRNVSVANSYVTCDFYTITANVTLNCTLHTFATDHYVAGDLVDVLYITPAVDFQS